MVGIPCHRAGISTPVLTLLKEVLANHSEVLPRPPLNTDTDIGLRLNSRFNREVIMAGGEIF